MRSGQFRHLPAFGVCGWSGSGKTTLIEQVVPFLIARGLSVAVVKHDAHGPEVDKPGKDSDRFFQAGANVCLLSDGENFSRSRPSSTNDFLPGMLRRLAVEHDIILVEGHKATPLPKVWLEHAAGKPAPYNLHEVTAVLPADADRPGLLLPLLTQWLQTQTADSPTFGCILIGGSSSRMGQPKHLLPASPTDSRTWLEKTVTILEKYTKAVAIAGAGAVPEHLSRIPRLPDIPGVRGPLAGFLAAMRWSPGANWIITGCDTPRISEAAIQWLLAHRRPGTWAIMPRLSNDSPPQPLPAFYSFRTRPLFEHGLLTGNARISQLAAHPRTATPFAPPELASEFLDIDTPQQLKAAFGET